MDNITLIKNHYKKYDNKIEFYEYVRQFLVLDVIEENRIFCRKYGDHIFFDFLYFDKFYMSYNYYNNSPFTYFEIMKLASFTTDLKTLNILLRHKNIQLLDIAIDILE